MVSYVPNTSGRVLPTALGTDLGVRCMAYAVEEARYNRQERSNAEKLARSAFNRILCTQEAAIIRRLEAFLLKQEIAGLQVRIFRGKLACLPRKP